MDQSAKGEQLAVGAFYVNACFFGHEKGGGNYGRQFGWLGLV